MNETIKVVAQDFPEYEDADGVLTYGYCDMMAGFTLELLCCVKRVGDSQFALKQTIENLVSQAQLEKEALFCYN